MRSQRVFDAGAARCRRRRHFCDPLRVRPASSGTRGLFYRALTPLCYTVRWRAAMKSSSDLYYLAINLFLAGLGVAFAAFFVLDAGFGPAVAEHRNPATWLIGLALALIAWLLLALSCAFGVEGY